MKSKAGNKSGLFWVCTDFKEVELEGGCLLAGYIPDIKFMGWLGCFLPPASDLHDVRAQLEVAVCISLALLKDHLWCLFQEGRWKPFVIKPMPAPLMKPLLVFVNPKSGGNQVWPCLVCLRRHLCEGIAIQVLSSDHCFSDVSAAQKTTMPVCYPAVPTSPGFACVPSRMVLS